MKLRPGDHQGYLAQVLSSSANDSVVMLGPNATNLPATSGQWRFSPAQPVFFPLDVTASTGQNLKLGGWFITKEKSGVIVSPMGMNGATLTMGGECSIQSWAAEGNAQPDLVHLSQNGHKKGADAMYQQLMSGLGLARL